MENNETPKETFARKMREVIIKKEVIKKRIEALDDEYRKLEVEEDRLEDEEFARTGSFSMNLKVDIKITERDVIDQFLKDNKDLEPENPNLN